MKVNGKDYPIWKKINMFETTNQTKDLPSGYLT